jgi:hypothetical protein
VRLASKRFNRARFSYKWAFASMHGGILIFQTASNVTCFSQRPESIAFDEKAKEKTEEGRYLRD